jgi:U3 small nucleolar RNA-associated protein 13
LFFTPAQVRVWDLVTRSCVAKLSGHFSAVTSLALSPDGWQLLSGGRDKVVCLWDLRTNARVATVPVYEALEGLAALPPGGAFPGTAAGATAAGAGAGGPVYFATAGERGQVRLWRSDTAQCVYTQRRDGGGAGAGAGSDAPGKKRKGVAGGAADDEGPPPAGAELTDLQLLPGGRGLMAATGDARLLFFAPDTSDTAAAAAARRAPPAAGGAAAASAARASSLVLVRQLVGNQDEVTDVVFCGDRDAPGRLAVATNAAEVRLYDVATMGCDASCVGHR